MRFFVAALKFHIKLLSSLANDKSEAEEGSSQVKYKCRQHNLTRTTLGLANNNSEIWKYATILSSGRQRQDTSFLTITSNKPGRVHYGAIAKILLKNFIPAFVQFHS